jgi:hypothetical protein
MISKNLEEIIEKYNCLSYQDFMATHGNNYKQKEKTYYEYIREGFAAFKKILAAVNDSEALDVDVNANNALVEFMSAASDIKSGDSWRKLRKSMEVFCMSMGNIEQAKFVRSLVNTGKRKGNGIRKKQ